MKFLATALPGVMIVEAEPHGDERGLFARLHCPEEFRRAGYRFVPVQTSISRNTKEGTLRGLHFQCAPQAETKLVRVIRGRAFDVAADMRVDSPSYRKWVGIELDALTLRAVLIPEGVAHGFITLEPNTDLLYQITPAFSHAHVRGVRWNDPAFGIEWPMPPSVISERDQTFPDFV